MASRLLEGVRVVELAEVWAGPMGGSLLGDLGADVIKVESCPRVPSLTRPLVERGAAPGEGPPYERSVTHHLVNRNKRNITLNLRDPRGVEPFERLLRSADVVYEGYTAGTIDAMGWGWDTVSAINPRLVMVSMPGWGRAGPYRGYATLGSGLDVASGHASVRGYPDASPDEVRAIFHSDATAALTLVVGVIAGLQQRERTGSGCYIDLSQLEALLWQMPGLFAEWTMNGRVPGRAGNVDPHVVPHDVYPTAEDEAWIFVAAEDDAQWAGLAQALGHPEWSRDGHPWATVTGRLAARREVDAAIAEFTSARPQSECADAIQAAGAIAAPVVDSARMVASPQLQAREWFQFVTHPYVGTRMMPGFPWSVQPDPPSFDRPCGLVGEHLDEVLGELGFSAEEIAAFERDAIVTRRYPVEQPAE